MRRCLPGIGAPIDKRSVRTLRREQGNPGSSGRRRLAGRHYPRVPDVGSTGQIWLPSSLHHCYTCCCGSFFCLRIFCPTPQFFLPNGANRFCGRHAIQQLASIVTSIEKFPFRGLGSVQCAHRGPRYFGRSRKSRFPQLPSSRTGGTVASPLGLVDLSGAVSPLYNTFKGPFNVYSF